MAKSLVVGNWKAYVTSLKDAKRLFKEIEKALPRKLSAEVVLCPPQVFIEPLASAYRGERISFGVQDAHFEAGAATGMVPSAAVKSVGAKYVIVGHAERRAMGEGDEIIAKKVGSVLDAKMTPILCVGEVARDREGAYWSELEKSIQASLAVVQEKDIRRLVIAYEPVWAIGAPVPPPARTVREAIIFIRKVLADLFGREAALKARILYGGAVDRDSAVELAEASDAHGFLLGRASVDAEAFGSIVSVFQ